MVGLVLAEVKLREHTLPYTYRSVSSPWHQSHYDIPTGYFTCAELPAAGQYVY